jgi:hemerythrin-like metal-binding protein
MDRLYEKSKVSIEKSEVITLIDELYDFVVIHFKREELYMEKIKFSGITNHKGIHQRLLSQLKRYKADFVASPSIKLSDRFFDFLTLWLSAHIQNVDMQYSPRYKQKAA